MKSLVLYLNFAYSRIVGIRLYERWRSLIFCVEHLCVISVNTISIHFLATIETIRVLGILARIAKKAPFFAIKIGSCLAERFVCVKHLPDLIRTRGLLGCCCPR